MIGRRLVVPLLSGALVLGLAACGGSGGSGASAGADPDAAYQPSGSPSVAVTMIDPPADYSTIEGEGFAISAPGEFQQQHSTSSNGEPMLVLEKPSGISSVPQRVAVVRDVDPKTPAVEQSFALETAKAAAGPAGEVERSALPATDDESGPAFLVTWKENRAGSGAGQVQVTYWQLLQQVGDDLILNVVAYAPSDEFETSEVSRILRTFVADASTAA